MWKLKILKIKVANIINSKGYLLNKQDVEIVQLIKSGMNRGEENKHSYIIKGVA